LANIEAKKQVVEEIKAKIEASKSVVLVDYKGLTVAEDTALRVSFRQEGIEYKVLKNTLVRKAFNELGVDKFDIDLNGPTAIAFGKDEIGPSRIIVEAAKKLNEKLTVKSAYVDGSYVDVAGVTTLANMPSKEQLIAKMLGSLQAPIANFAGVLSNTLKGLVVALNAIAEQK
jgi:large subunit ribosomal protein L10